MAFLPSKRINTNLTEEFEQLGIKTESYDLRTLSFNRLGESSVVPTDDLDSKNMTLGLIERITALLESDALTESDIDEIIDGLKDKEVDERNLGLVEASQALVRALFSQKERLSESELDESELDESDFDNQITFHMISRIHSLLDEGLDLSEIESIIDGLKELDEPNDPDLIEASEELVKKLLDEKVRFMTIDGKKRRVKVKHGSALSKARRQARKYARSAGGKKSAQRRARKMKSSSFAREQARKEKKARQLGTREEGVNHLALDLAKELRIDESNAVGADREIVERIERIFDLLKEHYSTESIDLVLNEAFNNMCLKLEEGASSTLESAKPCLRVISRLLEDIEGN